MDNLIKAHNNKILRKEEAKHTSQIRQCNCRDRSTCPVGNKCLKNNVVYEATVQHEGKAQKYIGMTENAFKTRYTNHKASFKHRIHRKQTVLSNLIWDLKDKNIDYKLTWKLIAQAQPYKPGKITCNLCLCEKNHV